MAPEMSNDTSRVGIENEQVELSEHYGTRDEQ